MCELTICGPEDVAATVPDWVCSVMPACRGYVVDVVAVLVVLSLIVLT
jgi:hypothetical protein